MDNTSMSKHNRPFTRIAIVIFVLVALSHLLRVVLAWPLIIADWWVPMWVSVVAFVMLMGLAWMLAREARRNAS